MRTNRVDVAVAPGDKDPEIGLEPQRTSCASPSRLPELQWSSDTLDEAFGEESYRPAWAYLDGALERISVLWPYSLRILGAAGAAMVGTFLVLLLIPNRYTAVAVLNPPDMSPVSGLSLLVGMRGGGRSGMESQVGDLLGLSSPGEAFVQSMQTRRIADALIQRFDLSRLYGTRTPEKTRRVLAAASKFSIDRKSNLIRIEVTDHDPRRAAALANAYAEELGKLDASVASEAGRRERDYFETQLQSAQQNLDRATRALGEFGKTTATIDPDFAGKGLADAAGQLQGQIIALQASLKGMRSIYTEKNENIRQTEAQIAELQSQLAKLAGPASSASKENATESGPSLAHIWGTAPSYMKLYADVKIQSAIVQTLTEQCEIARLREARRINDVQLLDPALPPERKSGPHRGLISLFFSAVVFLGSCGWLLFRNWWKALPSEDPWKQVIGSRLISLRNGKNALSTPLDEQPLDSIR